MIRLLVLVALVLLSSAAQGDALAQNWISNDYIRLTGMPCKEPQVVRYLPLRTKFYAAYVYTYGRQRHACWAPRPDGFLDVITDQGRHSVMSIGEFNNAPEA